MFLTLLKKECLQYLKSITYYIFLICLVVYFISQMGTFNAISKPEPGQEDYGYVRTQNKEQIMQEALESLLRAYDVNEYTTYPIGFYKRVILNDEEQKQVEQILLNITGLTAGELSNVYEEMKKTEQEFMEKAMAENAPVMESDLPDSTITIKKGLSYQEFLKEMNALDHLLGGGSDYSESNLKYTTEPATYEQALADYESLIKNDKVTNAYARLFCDYMGIMMAILPVFLSVTRAMKDRKAKAEQVIFIRKVSSVKIVLSRFLASVIVTVVPVFLLSCFTLMQAVYYAKGIHAEYDLFAFVKYIGFWLLPIILVSLSVGFFLTELTDSAIAILVQGVWWFVSIFMSVGDLVGSVGWNLVPRFNAVGQYAVYKQIEAQLVRNRYFYTAAEFLLILLTIFVFYKKRKGEFTGVGTILHNRKNKLEA